MPLAQILHRGNNNLDLLRLIAACMVIYSHSFYFLPQAGVQDYIRATLGFDDAGSLAVKIFFFLSGLVVTNSLLEKRDAASFVVARFFRVWPALLLVLLITTLVIGPVFSHLSLHDYYHSALTRSYFSDNVLLETRYELPGVFVNDGISNAINGSLWSLPYEVAAYLVLVAIFLVGAFSNRLLALAICVAFIANPIFQNKFLLSWLPQKTEFTMTLSCFAFGTALALYKDRIRIDLGVLIGLFVLFYIFSTSAQAAYFFYAWLFCTILYIASSTPLRGLKPRIDISYGVYLWGFPVQQILARLYPESGSGFNRLTAIVLCMALGYLSWHLVEKHGIALGARLAAKIKALSAAA